MPGLPAAGQRPRSLDAGTFGSDLHRGNPGNVELYWTFRRGLSPDDLYLDGNCSLRLAAQGKETAMYTADPVDDQLQTSYPELADWVLEISKLTTPEDVVWCNGSDSEWERLTDLLVENGTFTRLNPKIRPNSFWCASDPSDVARVEDRTFICAEKEDDAGPTNNWIAPDEMRRTLTELFDGCMRGRTMYVIPFCMGPLGGSISQLGVQITDSAYVAVSMRIMTRVGTPALRWIEERRSFVRAVHSVGAPLDRGQADVPWPCSTTKYITHFPETREIWSYGSGYGGNALLGKKCFALRIASVMARDEGWLAEHMLILKITPPNGDHLIDWKGRDWTPDSPEPAAHPNSRFTTPAAQCPIIAPEWDDPKGVPISAILFGGRRATTVPLVTESFDWAHGVFLGANISSEKTAAAEGKVGELRHDPFAMLPFCGYNMGDYFAYWLKIGRITDASKLPRIFYVNWFRKDEAGRFLWPGYGENIRVLKWIMERLAGEAAAIRSPVGNLPAPGALDTDGLDIAESDLDVLLSVDADAWRREAALIPEYFHTFDGHLPGELWDMYRDLVDRLG